MTINNPLPGSEGRVSGGGSFCTFKMTDHETQEKTKGFRGTVNQREACSVEPSNGHFGVYWS